MPVRCHRCRRRATARDEKIRPNQILAVSLPYSALPPAQMRAVVECCGRELLTSYGLRSLSAGDPGIHRDLRGRSLAARCGLPHGHGVGLAAGALRRAHYRVYGDARLAQSLLEPIAQHVNGACIGTVSEIFDGDAPHSARGCFAQAWSVAEILRSWIYLERKISKA